MVNTTLWLLCHVGVNNETMQLNKNTYQCFLRAVWTDLASRQTAASKRSLSFTCTTAAVCLQVLLDVLGHEELADFITTATGASRCGEAALGKAGAASHSSKRGPSSDGTQSSGSPGRTDMTHLTAWMPQYALPGEEKQQQSKAGA